MIDQNPQTPIQITVKKLWLLPDLILISQGEVSGGNVVGNEGQFTPIPGLTGFYHLSGVNYYPKTFVQQFYS